MLENHNNNGRLISTLLVAILLIALILRMSLLFWGFPHIDKFSNYFHSDEWPLKSAIYTFPHDIVTRTDLRYPTGYHYLLSVIILPVKLICLADGSLSIAEKGNIDLIAKLITMLFSLATVVLVYKFAAFLSKNKHVGLLAAALMTVVTISVNNSTYITTDTALAFFFTLFVYSVLKNFISDKGVPNKQAILVGVLFGYLTAIKYTGAIAVILLPWLLYDYIKTRRWIAASRIAGLFSIFSVLTFFFVTPSALIHPKAIISSLSYELGRLQFVSKPGNYMLFLHSYIKAFNPAIGVLCAVALIYYMVVIVYLQVYRFLGKSNEHRTRSTKLVIPLVILVLFFSWYFRNWIMPRYFLMIVPVSILAAIMFWFTWWKKSHTSAILCMVLVVFFSLQSITVNWLHHVQDNRRAASKYILSSNMAGTIVNHGGNQCRPSLTSVKSKFSYSPTPEYLVISTTAFPPLAKFMEAPFEKPEGPKYSLKFYVQYPREKERYDLLFDAIVEQKSYTLVKKFEIDTSWIRKFMVATLWEPEIRIYKKVDRKPPASVE